MYVMKIPSTDIVKGFFLRIFQGVEKFLINFSVFKIIGLIFFCDWTDYTARIACCKRPIGNVFCNDATSADDWIIANPHARANYNVAANSYVVTDNDFHTVFVAECSYIGVQGMPCRIKSYVRRNETIFTKCDFRIVEKGAVIIDKTVFPYMDIWSIIAIKGRIDKGRFVRRAEEFVDDGADLNEIIAIGGVERLCQTTRAFHFHLIVFVG